MKESFISIITVCYNAEKLIERTIQSVINQTKLPNIEYIIIDGLSTDSTYDIIEKYNAQIDVMISEKDKGIYDAMNKGLKQAGGKYILFLNAGDYLSQPNLIEELMAKSNNEDIIYGETILYKLDNTIIGSRSEVTTRKLPEVLQTSSFKKGLVISHQSFIPKLKITQPFMANNLSADLDWVINCTKNSTSRFRSHTPISHFLIGGISDQNKMRSLKDRAKVMIKHYGLATTFFIHGYILLRHLFLKVNIRI